MGHGARGCRAPRRARGVLWAYERETVEEINDVHCNQIYLPGVTLEPARIAPPQRRGVAAADLILMVVPSQFFRSVAGEFEKHIGAKPVIICTKGFEEDTGKMMADIIAEALPEAMPGVHGGTELRRRDRDAACPRR